MVHRCLRPVVPVVPCTHPVGQSGLDDVQVGLVLLWPDRLL